MKIYHIRPFIGFLLRIFFSTLIISDLNAAPGIEITDSHPTSSLENNVLEYIDKASVSPLEVVLRKGFHPTRGGTPNYNPGVKSVWLKFKAGNNSAAPTLYLNIAFAN